MKITHPEVKRLTYDYGDSVSLLKHIEACGRTCYRSEDRLTDTSYQTFVSNIIKRNHGAVLEHANYAFEVDDWTFATLGDILYTMEDQDGINSYIRRSKKDDGQHIVSGNVRAWRELIYYALKSGWTLDVFAPLLVQEDPAKKLLFYSIVEGLGEKVTAYFSKGQEDYTMKLIDWNDPQVANRLSPNDYLVHCPATFRFITDRGVSHEAVRHRPASYAQESTRYCAYSKDKFGGQVTYVDIASAFELDPKVNGLEDNCVVEIYKEWLLACEDAERHYLRMLELGSSPQMARSVLNNSTKTALVMTATLGEWAHYCKLRTDVAAHPQIREIAVQVNNQLAALNLIGLPFKEMTL